ncbi:PIN domain-containing protein [Methylomonas lenta]|uniref:PIN domain-containing protein n=1 Tax=Methylomonas lenta TaxID=980561 RepID=A0A177N6H4_9GAMM|nr:PIN domain-containing protein [Methylomonas lenta]OAI12730.1 PIN domain-containing protein [Methylomonas lenta]
MSRLLISDANILIDLEVGGLMLELFKLPYQIQVPDMLFADELEADHGYLLEHGLLLGELSSASMAEVETLVIKYKQPSRYDCFALMLAKQEQCPLLTGDQNIRNAAKLKNVDVKGTLWIIEAMIEHQIISIQTARAAYRNMEQQGRRLPWVLAEKRLGDMEAKQ